MGNNIAKYFSLSLSNRNMDIANTNLFKGMEYTAMMLGYGIDDGTTVFSINKAHISLDYNRVSKSSYSNWTYN
jgi:hypothetical protein